MKKIVRASGSTVNYREIKLALSKMQELINILDDMDDATYWAFDDNSAGDVYTLVSDSIMSIKNGVLNSKNIQ